MLSTVHTNIVPQTVTTLCAHDYDLMSFDFEQVLVVGGVQPPALADQVRIARSPREAV
jgi:hypothetical protein